MGLFELSASHKVIITALPCDHYGQAELNSTMAAKHSVLYTVYLNHFRLSCLLLRHLVSSQVIKIATKPTIMFRAKDHRVNCKMMPLSQHWHHCHCFLVSWWSKAAKYFKVPPKIHHLACYFSPDQTYGTLSEAASHF